MQDQIRKYFEYSSEVMAKSAELLPEKIAAAARIIIASLRSGGTVAFCGNGGSAAQAQHFAGELVGRFLLDRPAYRAIALTTDTSIITCIANDFSYEEVFSRQVEGLLKPHDVLIVLSTSGNSANCLQAVELARQMKIKTIAFSGCGGGKLADAAELCITVRGYETPQIQEAHLASGHILCQIVEEALVAAQTTEDA